MLKCNFNSHSVMLSQQSSVHSLLHSFKKWHYLWSQEHSDEQYKIPNLKFNSIWGKQIRKTRGIIKWKCDIKEMYVQHNTEGQTWIPNSFGGETEGGKVTPDFDFEG